MTIIETTDPNFDERDTLITGAPAVLRPDLPTMPDLEVAASVAPPLYIAARNFTPGRRGAAPAVVVVHTTENICAPGIAMRVASWFAMVSAPTASAHYVVGPDVVVQCVDENDTAWCAPGCNTQGIHVEQTALASYTAEQWATDEVQAMLRRSAALVADICRRHGIPIVRIGSAELRRGAQGITGHVDVSRAWHKSDHYDPGAAFPWAQYLDMVRAS